MPVAKNCAEVWLPSAMPAVAKRAAIWFFAFTNRRVVPQPYMSYCVRQFSIVKRDAVTSTISRLPVCRM